jgi:DNA-binding IclR family transcriptional regulator
VAGLSISAPSSRLQDAWIPQLVATAATISEALGYETGATSG